MIRTKTIAALAILPMLAASCSMGTSAGTARETAAADGTCNKEQKLGESEAGLELLQLCITSGTKKHAFAAELASTPQQQAQGLMFRKSLADDAGMIFPFAPPRPASFWMKNTLIPLDIIFVADGGRIESIAKNTEPYSLAPVKSVGSVNAVLELRGGLTAELGIKPGDTVAW